MKKFSLRAAVLGAAAFALIGTPARAADEALKLLHPETEAVMTFKMKDMLGTPLFKKFAMDKFKAAIDSNAELQAVMKSTGLDPMKDLDKVTLGISGNTPADMKVTGVLEGKFDAAKINAAIKAGAEKKKEKLVTLDIGGKTVYEFPVPPEAGGGNWYASIVSDSKIAMASKKELITSIIESKTTGPKAKEIGDLVGKVDSKSVFSMVGMLKGKFDQLPIPDGDENVAKLKKLLPKVESMIVELKAEKDVDLSIALGTDSTDTAKSLTELLSPYLDQVKGVVPIFAGQAPQIKPFIEVINSLKVEGKDKSTVLSATMKEEVLEKAIPK